MLKNRLTAALLSVLVIGLFVPLVPRRVAAQDTNQPTRQQLEQELKDVEKQIAQYEQQLTTIKGQKNTLANKIKQLKAKQATLSLQIKATNLKVAALGKQITQTKEAISKNEAKLDYLRTQIAEYVRLMNQRDGYTFFYWIMLGGNLSNLFSEFQAYIQVSESLQNALGEVRQLKLEQEKKSDQLADQQDESKNLLSLKLLQQHELGSSVNEQQILLTQTRGRESSYQKTLSTTKQRASEIRGRIYQLLGVGSQITFGQALQIAQWVADRINVRPAFLLAILTQESNLGKNVGTCNRLGDPPEKGWKVIMKPTRDQQPFLTITSELGMNPEVTPVSCPMRNKSGNQIGWGGAMGPAQFIPSTWLGYRDRVSSFTGKRPPNPWDIRDAFVAAALLLRGNGADGTKQGEWNAAMRYFSGSTNAQFRFYGDNVVVLADKYQNDIEALNASK